MRLDAQVQSTTGDCGGGGRLAVGDNRREAAAKLDEKVFSKLLLTKANDGLPKSASDKSIDGQRRRRRRQMAPSSRRKEHHAHNHQQQQQQVSSRATTTNFIGSLSSAGSADQMASLTQMSSYLMNSFHNNNNNNNNNQQQQQTPQSPLHGFMSAAALASVAAAARHQQQQQQQQHELLLSQFASLHSLSAVASAIQQQQHHQQQSNNTANLNQSQQPLNFGLAEQHQQYAASCLTERLARHSLAGSAHPTLHPLPYTHQAATTLPPVSSRPSQVGVPLPAGHFTSSGLPSSTLVSSSTSANATTTTGSIGTHSHYQLVTHNHQHPVHASTLTNHLQHGGVVRRPRRRGARKCRKMYGMAQRQLWCTQCKWKKACSRFLAQMGVAVSTSS